MITLLAEFQFTLNPFAIEDKSVLVSLLLGLALLLFLLIKAPPSFPLGFRALGANLNTRQTRIAEDQAQVQRALSDVQQVRNDYATRLQRIEAEARERIDAAVREAETARTEIIAEAQSSANALRRRSEEEIARERTVARIAMRRQIVAATLDAAEASVRANNDPNVQHALISDFIARAGQGRNGNNGTGGASGPASARVYGVEETPAAPMTFAANTPETPEINSPANGPGGIPATGGAVDFGVSNFGEPDFGASQTQSSEGV